jgi:hypothetical protein
VFVCFADEKLVLTYRRTDRTSILCLRHKNPYINQRVASTFNTSSLHSENPWLNLNYIFQFLLYGYNSWVWMSLSNSLQPSILFNLPNHILCFRVDNVKLNNYVTLLCIQVGIQKYVNSYYPLDNFVGLVGNPTCKKPLGRPRRRWEDNVRMDLREVWWEDVDWMYVVQDRDQWRALMNTVINIRFHKRQEIRLIDERLLDSQLDSVLRS